MSPSDRMRSTETQEIPFQKKKKPLFYCEVDQTLEQAVQKISRVSILGDVQNPTGHKVQVDLIEPTLSRWVGLSNLQRSLTTSAVLWVGDSMKLDSSLLMLTSTQLGCGKLSSKNYSSRTFGHLTNWSCSTNKDWRETQQQRERSILLGWQMLTLGLFICLC